MAEMADGGRVGGRSANREGVRGSRRLEEKIFQIGLRLKLEEEERKEILFLLFFKWKQRV